LGKVPTPVHALKDAGPYLAAAVAIAKDPDSGARSASMPRCQVVNRNTLHVNVELDGALELYLERGLLREAAAVPGGARAPGPSPRRACVPHDPLRRRGLELRRPHRRGGGA